MYENFGSGLVWLGQYLVHEYLSALSTKYLSTKYLVQGNSLECGFLDSDDSGTRLGFYLRVLCEDETTHPGLNEPNSYSSKMKTRRSGMTPPQHTQRTRNLGRGCFHSGSTCPFVFNTEGLLFFSYRLTT